MKKLMLLTLSICILLGISYQSSLHEETKSTLLNHSKAIQDSTQSLINLQVQMGDTKSKIEEFGDLLNKTRSDVDIISVTELVLEYLRNQITVINSQIENIQDPIQQLEDAQTYQQQFLQNVKIGLENIQAQIQELNNQIQNQVSSLEDLNTAIRLYKLKTTSFWRDDIWYLSSDEEHDFNLLTQGNYDSPDHPLYNIGVTNFQDKHPWNRSVVCL